MTRKGWNPISRLALAVALATALVALLPAAALAQASGDYVLGLELRAVDKQARTVSAVQHCTSPDRAGQVATFAVSPAVDMGPMEPGHVLGARIDGSTEPDTVVEVGPPPCDFRPGGGGAPGQQPGPGGPGQPPGGDGFGPGPQGCPPPPQQPPAQPAGGPSSGPPSGGPPNGGPGAGPGCGGPPDFARGFLSRVWKFVGAADTYDNGKLSMTVERILNVPRRYRSQDDDLIDEDALVLVGRARVYAGNRRVDKSELDRAESVRVHGKLLPPSRWAEDEDGLPVTTIRAKKVYILG